MHKVRDDIDVIAWKISRILHSGLWAWVAVTASRHNESALMCVAGFFGAASLLYAIFKEN